MDHEDAGILGVLRGVEPHGAAGDEQLSLVGAVETHEEIAQRCLAGSVLAEQSVHLPLGSLERHVIVRDDAGEALGHVDGIHRQCPRHRAGGIGSGARRWGRTRGRSRLVTPSVEHGVGHRAR